MKRQRSCEDINSSATKKVRYNYYTSKNNIDTTNNKHKCETHDCIQNSTSCIGSSCIGTSCIGTSYIKKT
jgi:hypothetical protein